MYYQHIINDNAAQIKYGWLLKLEISNVIYKISFKS